MIGEFVEKNRQTLILLLSVLIIGGSGVSLGFGIAELSKSSSPLQTSGFEKVAPSDLGIEKPQPSGPININTASALELEALTGIGPSKAAAIVSYRQETGPFKNISDIQNVSGIGSATYAKLKDQITVK
jgi:competence ComEA-like helix-hairpin-helix protein